MSKAKLKIQNAATIFQQFHYTFKRSLFFTVQSKQVSNSIPRNWSAKFQFEKLYRHNNLFIICQPLMAQISIKWKRINVYVWCITYLMAKYFSGTPFLHVCLKLHLTTPFFNQISCRFERFPSELRRKLHIKLTKPKSYWLLIHRFVIGGFAN